MARVGSLDRNLLNPPVAAFVNSLCLFQTSVICMARVVKPTSVKNQGDTGIGSGNTAAAGHRELNGCFLGLLLNQLLESI